jgi:hypothetical protein
MLGEPPATGKSPFWAGPGEVSSVFMLPFRSRVDFVEKNRIEFSSEIE